MGLYGNKFINSSVVEEITYEQMMDIYYDSHYQIESLFRDIDHSYLSLNEDTLAISGPVQKASFKETLKKIIDKAKELFDNFVKWISTCIKRFTEWITKVYNQTNVKDSIMSKIGKNLTWDNIKSAIEQGWKGLPKEKGLCLVKEMNPTTLRASELLRDATNKDKEYNKIIEKINKTETLEIAEEHYKEFEQEFISETRRDTIPSSVNMIIWHNDLKLSSKDLKARFNNLTEEDLLYDYITFSAGESQDKKHLLVNESGFNSTKKMALYGEVLTKWYKNDLNDAVKVIKQDVLDPLQRESNNISGGEALTDNDKIYLIYNKARIKVAEYVVKLGMRAVKDQTTIMKYLNSQAIRTYLYLLSVNRKYNGSK